MNVRTALQQGADLLNEAAVPAPRLTAEVLLAHALKRDRVYLFAHPEQELDRIAWIHFGRYLHERLDGKPTQYITKRQEFYGRDFRVTPSVLIPRPETEFVVSAALERITRGARVVDVGTGSGAIAVTIALEAGTPTIALDVSDAALAVARRNAADLNAPVSFLQGDLLQACRPMSLDMVVSNPPYVALHEKEGMQREVRDFEPHLALFAGQEGSEVYRRLVAEAEIVLRPGGWLVLELGYRSLDPVRSMLQARWSQIEVVPDLAGIPRALAAQWTS